MGAKTGIEWTDDTFNPWWGCEKVSPACAHCYAETWAKRTGHKLWGRGAERRFFGDKHWQEPVKWNREAREFARCACGFAGPVPFESGRCPKCQHSGLVYERRRVFCASMADWLEDRDDLTPHLARLLALIHATPHLDWLLLTKRPGNFHGRVEAATGQALRGKYPIEVWEMAYAWWCGYPPQNVWVGTTVEDQTRAEERIPELLRIPATVRFLSCEPLLGPVELRTIEDEKGRYAISLRNPDMNRIHWVIAGGESGAKARPMHPEWARSLRDQCAAAGVPFFFKQWGEWAPGHNDALPQLTTGPGEIVCRFGKKAAGRKLDGREWSEFSAVGVNREGAKGAETGKEAGDAA